MTGWLLILCLLMGCASGMPSPAGQDASGTETEAVPGSDPADGSSAAPSGEGTASGETSDEEESAEEEYWSRAMAKRSQEYEPGSGELTAAEGFEAAPKRDYTLMIYMIGSNLESKAGKASADIKEIAAAGIDYAKTNVIAYTGGSRKWSANIPCDKNSVLDLAEPDDSWIMAQTKGNADMGAAETLTAFLDFCAENYPADHYGLIFWDHGAGPLWGYGSDELFDSDALLLSEMDSALAASAFSGKRLDFVGFDACLMASAESMGVWSKYADYYVGSEELEPGNGWDYSCLSILNEAQDPRDVVTRIVERYGIYYEGIRSGQNDPDITLAAADLTKISAVLGDVSKLASAMSGMAQGGEYPALKKLRADVKSFGNLEDTRSGDAWNYDLVDLRHLAEQMKDRAPADSERLLADLDRLIVAKTANIEHAGGVTIYYPDSNISQYRSSSETYREAPYEWRELLQTLAARGRQERGQRQQLSPLQAGDGEYTLKLTKEQLESGVSFSYTVLKKYREGKYIPYLSKVRIEPDGEGVLHVPADPELVCMTSGDGENLLSVTQTEQTDTREYYRTEDLRLRSTPGAEILMLDVTQERVRVFLKKDRQSGAFSIRNVTAQDENVEFDGKDTVDVRGWASLDSRETVLIPHGDERSTLLPVEEWIEPGEMSHGMLLLEEGFGFSAVPVSEFSDSFAVLVEMEDASGILSASELTDLPDPEGRGEIEHVATEKGELVFRVHSDHAALLSCTGSDSKVSVPSEVRGVPVTEIAAGAFANFIMGISGSAHPVEELVLPETVRTIGPAAFYGCGSLKTVVFPQKLEEIGSMAFCSCDNLEEIALPPSLTGLGSFAFFYCSALKNVTLPGTLKKAGRVLFFECGALETISLSGAGGALRLIDGALYTADGKTLLACPALREGRYEVAEGTEEIAFGAFCDAQIGEVLLPESLKKIDAYAFHSCLSLAAPVLPESLTEIGAYAFGTSILSLKYERLAEEAQRIRIGRSVDSVGGHAFDLFPTLLFEVSPENEWYSGKDGFLMNPAMDAVLQEAVLPGGVIRLPEGTAALEDDLFSRRSSFSPGTAGAVGKEWIDLVIPDSVFLFPESVSDNDLKYYRIHCSPGSAAEEFALRTGFPFDHNLSPEYGIAEEETAGGTLTYMVFADHAAAIRYEGTDTEVAIPEEIRGVPVTQLGGGASGFLADDAEVNRLTLPETLLKIEDYALGRGSCGYLHECAIPQGVEEIGRLGLNGLTNVTIGALPPGLRSLGEKALPYNMEGVLTIPKTLTRIHEKAFESCTQITAFAVEEGNPSYMGQDGVLYTADGKTLAAFPKGFTGQSHEIPDSVEEIGPYAFSNNWKMIRFSLPDSVRRIGPYAFYNCGQLREMELPSALEEIGESAFRNAESLTNVSFPETLTAIGENAFANCTSLEEIALPEGVRSVGAYSFEKCSGVRSVSLPDSLGSAGWEAFLIRTGKPAGEEPLYIGSSLTEIGTDALAFSGSSAFEVSPENPEYAEKDGFLADRSGKILVLCPAGKSGTVEIPEGITFVSKGAFTGAFEVTDVVVPESVEAIDYDAFRGWEYDEEKGELENYSSPVTVHCKRGSAAERYCQQYQIRCVTE